MKKTWLPGIVLTVVFWLMCWNGIGWPTNYNFDEFHYIPVAKTYLTTGKMMIPEHPPLGKLLIASSVKLMGDTPEGWRFMATLFGGLTLLGLYAWALVLFRSVKTAFIVAILTICNQALFVESRIGMLDVFMGAFLVWAGVCFSFWWQQRDKLSPLLLSAALMGFGIATKWFVLIPFGFTGLILLYLLSKKKITFQNVIYFSLMAFGTYAMTYLPLVITDPDRSFTILNFIDWQRQIWDGQRNVPGEHPYVSTWWSWPLMLRPIWYHYEILPMNSFRGIIFLANPLFIWGGFIGVIWSAYEAFKKDQQARGVLFIYTILFIGYAVIPRKSMFFYYYYPSLLSLGLVWGWMWEKFKSKYFRFILLTINIFLFFYFLPILRGDEASMKNIGQWLWFSNWI